MLTKECVEVNFEPALALDCLFPRIVEILRQFADLRAQICKFHLLAFLNLTSARLLGCLGLQKRTELVEFFLQPSTDFGTALAVLLLSLQLLSKSIDLALELGDLLEKVSAFLFGLVEIGCQACDVVFLLFDHVAVVRRSARHLSELLLGQARLSLETVGFVAQSVPTFGQYRTIRQ